MTNRPRRRRRDRRAGCFPAPAGRAANPLPSRRDGICAAGAPHRGGIVWGRVRRGGSLQPPGGYPEGPRAASRRRGRREGRAAGLQPPAARLRAEPVGRSALVRKSARKRLCEVREEGVRNPQAAEGQGGAATVCEEAAPQLPARKRQRGRADGRGPRFLLATGGSTSSPWRTRRPSPCGTAAWRRPPPPPPGGTPPSASSPGSGCVRAARARGGAGEERCRERESRRHSSLGPVRRAALCPEPRPPGGAHPSASSAGLRAPRAGAWTPLEGGGCGGGHP